MRPGLRFSKAQHDTIAYLACDIAARNNWPLDQEWWRSARLLGHEDLTPITRKDKFGGWDPGYLRDIPFFDWDYVYDKIEEIKNGGYKLPGRRVALTGSGSEDSIFEKSKNAVGRLYQSGRLLYIASEAISNGERDERIITNRVFYAKHPSKQGHKIKRHDPLVNDWLNIRNTIVRPLLGGLNKTRKNKSESAGYKPSRNASNVINPTTTKVRRIKKYRDRYTENTELGLLTKDREGMHIQPAVPKGPKDKSGNIKDRSGVTLGVGIDLTTFAHSPARRRQLAQQIMAGAELTDWILSVPTWRGEAVRKWLDNNPMPGNGLSKMQLDQLYRFSRNIFQPWVRARLLGKGTHGANPTSRLTEVQYDDLALDPTSPGNDFLLELLVDLMWNSAHFAHGRQNNIAQALKAKNVKGDRYERQIAQLGNLRKFIETGNFGGLEGRWKRLGWIDARIAQLRSSRE